MSISDVILLVRVCRDSVLKLRAQSLSTLYYNMPLLLLLLLIFNVACATIGYFYFLFFIFIYFGDREQWAANTQAMGLTYDFHRYTDILSFLNGTSWE